MNTSPTLAQRLHVAAHLIEEQHLPEALLTFSGADCVTVTLPTISALAQWTAGLSTASGTDVTISTRLIGEPHIDLAFVSSACEATVAGVRFWCHHADRRPDVVAGYQLTEAGAA